MAQKRHVPPEILKPISDAYKEYKKKHPGKAPKGKAQFEYEGVTYTLKKKNKSGDYSAVPAWMEARDARNRDGRVRNQQIKLSSIEQMMVDNIYQEGSKRGLAVDHEFPIAKGGPSNAPWNLVLRTQEVNGSKGDKVGGNYPKEPFLDPQIEAVIDQAARFTKGVNAMASKAFNRFQTASDIFNQGRSGSQLDQALNMIPDTSETDLGRHLGNGITNGITNGANELAYMAKEISNGKLPYNGD